MAAGNPSEYNKSVREFDIVTLDRVRKIEIYADCGVWLEYAIKKQVHGAVFSYLGLKPEHFYMVENTLEGKFFVTARGWEDLSEILKSYEEADIFVSEELVLQYLQNEEIAGSFYVYYQLYCKYGMDYGIIEILNGTMPEEAYKTRVQMAASGGFEERFMVVNLILNYLHAQIAAYTKMDDYVTKLHEELCQIRKKAESEKILSSEKCDAETQEIFLQILERTIEMKKAVFAVKKKQELFSISEERQELWMRRKLETYLLKMKQMHETNGEQQFNLLKGFFQEEVKKRKQFVQGLQKQLEEAFAFVEACFQEGQEMVLLVSGLARNEQAVKFFSIHECEAFLLHSKVLLFKNEEKSLIKECENLLEQQ